MSVEPGRSGSQEAPARWSEAECRLLRAHYLCEGLTPAVCALLPGRSAASIYTKAAALGLRRQPHRAPASSTPALDAAIRRLYGRQRILRKGELKVFCAKWERTPDWVRTRAYALGALVASRRAPNWSAPELDLLEENAGRSSATIRRVLARAGYRRSIAAIDCRIRLCGYERVAVFHYGTAQLAELLGVGVKVVERWIGIKALKARRSSDSPLAPYEIAAKDVRAFMIDHVGEWDHTRIDRWWLVDILTGRGE